MPFVIEFQTALNTLLAICLKRLPQYENKINPEVCLPLKNGSYQITLGLNTLNYFVIKKCDLYLFNN